MTLLQPSVTASANTFFKCLISNRYDGYSHLLYTVSFFIPVISCCLTQKQQIYPSWPENVLIFCRCVVCSLSLSWIGNWKRSITAFPRRSASTYRSSCKTKISKRTRCSPPRPIIAVPVQARARPPTAPRPLTRQRPVGALCTGAGTIAPPLWPTPLRRPPRPSCQTQKCRSIKTFTRSKEYTTGVYSDCNVG